jgi:hypothetical protein
MVTGEFLTKANKEYYVIRNVDKMPQFFISMVSDNDHWLFAGSQGGISAGRVSPETALFPYSCVDKLYDTALSTGSRTLCRGKDAKGRTWSWEPFNYEQDGKYAITRNLYKSVLGNTLCYEEINHDLNLAFEYSWHFSDEFGICRNAKLRNLSSAVQPVEVLDGIQNVLPAGTPRFTQSNSSNLVDAYKWTELDNESSIALFTLYSAITDRAEPVESLRATSVHAFADDKFDVLINPDCIQQFKRGDAITVLPNSRGVRGVYFTHLSLELAADESKQWWIIANTEQDQGQIAALKDRLKSLGKPNEALLKSIDAGSDRLASIMARADGFQATAEKEVSVHHYANTLFNVLRGGIFANQYHISKRDFLSTLGHFNKSLAHNTKSLFSDLGEWVELQQLQQIAIDSENLQLLRLINEYLPITFGRRHGDPSRPWNQFAIELKDSHGNPLLSYQGNWRDIFQNWEALAYSYPSFIDSMIAKFVNASTMDGYNPYRITKKGIDWEVEEPDDPWSYIGYWGDHQIIYLLKLLEVSQKFAPQKLTAQLQSKSYSYANVPYRIRSFAQICENPKATVDYDWHASETIDKRVANIGADGRLVLQESGEVYQVSLLEKLLVPLLTKLSNLVIDGGIWLNTQRPEWNDANNALVGQGLSMVTLYYMHRYLDFLKDLLEGSLHSEQDSIELTTEVSVWLNSTLECMQQANATLSDAPMTPSALYHFIETMGLAAEKYRNAVYQHENSFSSTHIASSQLIALIDNAMSLVKRSIANNKEQNGLYHAYNTISLSDKAAEVAYLYPMLEGQVAALSSGALSASEAVDVLDALFASDIYRADIDTFMLYPDRTQTPFMQKNCVDASLVEAIPLIQEMLNKHDRRIMYKDANQVLRFNSDITNAAALTTAFESLSEEYAALIQSETLKQLLKVYEATFAHSQFTGRSGGMFGFEGLGSVYWHMTSKLLLAIQEVTQRAYADGEASLKALMTHYYKVRQGIGYNKTPEQYGAFPTDPYSHTPKHAGAQQPGMTGQVKEEILTRFGELGCQVEDGIISFAPFLLRPQEFLASPADFKYLDVNDTWQSMQLPKSALAFTWCQVPIVYIAQDDIDEIAILVEYADGSNRLLRSSQLDADTSRHIFARDAKVKALNVSIPKSSLFVA